MPAREVTENTDFAGGLPQMIYFLQEKLVRRGRQARLAELFAREPGPYAWQIQVHTPPKFNACNKRREEQSITFVINLTLRMVHIVDDASDK